MFKVAKSIAQLLYCNRKASAIHHTDNLHHSNSPDTVKLLVVYWKLSKTVPKEDDIK